MRIPRLAVLACLALAACNSEPTFDASSQATYLKSLDAINAKLSVDDRRRLDIALLTLALGNTVQANGLQYANSAALNDLVMLNGVANPLNFLDRLRPSINGRSAGGVIGQVISDLDDQIARSEAVSAGAYKELNEVVVDHARYHWDRLRKLPILEFSVYNGTKAVISRIHVSGVLTLPGRPGRWLTGGLTYKFDRGLSPGVAMPVTLVPRLFSVRTAQQLENAYDANVTLKVSNIEDANGQKLVRVDTDILDGMRSKRDFLRGS